MTRLTNDWLARQRGRADAPPLRPRVPLKWGDIVLGSVEPDFLRPFEAMRDAQGRPLLQALAGVAGWRLSGDLDDSLARLAGAMREAGLAGAWRNELLAVRDAQGNRLGAIERAAVRPLGIATHAVHLSVSTSLDGGPAQVWVQQRAWDKANDPGMWDTTVGGMVPAADSLEQALERETWEEAGLRLGQLHDLARGGRLWIRRPADDGAGAGYVVECIDWYQAQVGAGVAPSNQDGEVQAFECWHRSDLVRALQENRFTLEAALILAAQLGESTGSERDETIAG